MTGVSGDFTAAWDRCVQPLPASEGDAVLNFCLVVRRASSAEPFSFPIDIEPAFAEVEVSLRNLVDNTPVNCTAFDNDTTPSRIMVIRYTFYWLERMGTVVTAMNNRSRFFGSPIRGITP
jgi:hypothetical protein